jgi:TRAP transporter TAXI family solute receptor
MRRQRRSSTAGWLTAVVLSACLGCSTAAEIAPGVSEPVRGSVVISAGDPTGVYHAWSEQLAKQLKVTSPRLRVSVKPSDGSVQNLDRLRSGVADLGLSTVDATEQVARADFSPVAADASAALKVPLRALGRIYDDYVQIVVRADSNLHTVADLDGHRVAVNTQGSGTALVAGRVLKAARISVTESDLGVALGMAALEQKQVDAVFWSGGIPTPSIAATAGKVKLRLLPLGDLAAALRATYGSVYRPATIPPGRYPGTEEVATLASANVLVARADADPGMVTAVLSTIFDQRDVIGAAIPAANATDRRTAIWTGSLELHPAAIAYYRRSKP